MIRDPAKNYKDAITRPTLDATALAGDICISGCSVESTLSPYWDVLVAPVSFSVR